MTAISVPFFGHDRGTKEPRGHQLPRVATEIRGGLKAGLAQRGELPAGIQTGDHTYIQQLGGLVDIYHTHVKNVARPTIIFHSKKKETSSIFSHFPGISVGFISTFGASKRPGFGAD